MPSYQKLQCRLSAPYILVACDGGLQRKKINTDDHLSMCSCSGGTELDKAAKFRISRSAWCTFSRGEQIRGYVHHENEHRGAHFRGWCTNSLANLCAGARLRGGGGGGTNTLLHRIGTMILKAGFHFSVSFLSPFSPFFFCFTKMTRVLPQFQTCFQFIYLFINSCIFIHLPPRRRRRPRVVILVVVHRLRLEKTLRLGRNCLLRSRYIACEAPSFLPEVLHRHAQFNTSKVIETFEAHPTLATPARNRSCRHFSFPWCTPYVNVKLSGAFFFFFFPELVRNSRLRTVIAQIFVRDLIFFFF